MTNHLIEQHIYLVDIKCFLCPSLPFLLPSFISQSIPFIRLLPTIIVYDLYLCTFLSCTQ
uniref:Ovule protein n=1 Tax=Heterorhabditis bacteriophora TaxID=37862 RepID=A0A1I7W930_HETBA